MRGYLDLMKLRVVELLLVSTLPAMVLAAKGLPEFGLAFATIFAGTLAAGSANAFNMVIESDLDKLMARTAKRPVVTGQISKKNATVFATLIGVLSLIIFWIFTTPLATLLALIAIVFYVVVYTMALKQRTAQNIVWGGAAGCMPVLIGWAAVTNSLSLTAWAFFFVIFFKFYQFFNDNNRLIIIARIITNVIHSNPSPTVFWIHFSCFLKIIIRLFIFFLSQIIFA